MDMRQLVRAFDAGRVDADTLVWRKGMPDWRRLRDISELAERLVGSGDSSEKSSNEQAVSDFAQSSSEPPPRQSERSRTPPASYTVGARSGSEPPAATASDVASTGVEGASAMSQSSTATQNAATQNAATQVRNSSSSVPPAPDEPTAAERTSVAPAVEGRGSAPPSRRSTPSAAPRGRRGRSKTPSRPNASPAPVGSRTVTQTGLESPAEVTARNSVPPQAGSHGLPSDGPARTRESRTSFAPGGTRRPSSSDETPAQKPSSLSVPPGALLGSPAKPRGRRFIALAAVVLGGAILLVKQVATIGESPSVTADQRIDAVHEPKQVEKSLAPDRKAAAAQPAPLSAEGTLPSTVREPRSRANVAPEPTAATGSTSAASASVAGSSAAPGNFKTSSKGTSPSAPLNAEASAKETVDGPIGAMPVVVAPAPAAGAAREATSAPVPAAKPPVASAPIVASPARPAAAPAPKPLPVPAKPEPGAQPEPTPAVPREPRPFDETLATQQFQAAASKASDCAQQGSTRGTGRVKVAIEPWGRVGRVTHLNQDFVGTPVGLCVMQAFQEIRVAPFDGNSRSIAGEFVVQ
jgi:hypothetical protein